MSVKPVRIDPGLHYSQEVYMMETMQHNVEHKQTHTYTYTQQDSTFFTLNDKTIGSTLCDRSIIPPVPLLCASTKSIFFMNNWKQFFTSQIYASNVLHEYIILGLVPHDSSIMEHIHKMLHTGKYYASHLAKHKIKHYKGHKPCKTTGKLCISTMRQ